MSTPPPVPTTSATEPASPIPAGGAAPPAPPADPAPPATPPPDNAPAKAARAIAAAAAEKRARVAAEQRAQAAEQRAQAAEQQAKGISAKLDRFKSDPMGALEAVGMTYEEVTRAAIQKHGRDTPAARIEAIEAKLKADEAAATKAREDQDRQAQAQQTRANVVAWVDGVHAIAAKDKAAYEVLTAQDPDYAKGLIYDVADEIARKTGRVPNAKTVLDAIENYLVDEGVKLAGSAKVKAKLAPKVEAKPADQIAPENPAVKAQLEERKRRQAPRTLTNKLAAAPVEKPPAMTGKLSPQDAMRVAMAAFRDAKAKEPGS